MTPSEMQILLPVLIAIAFIGLNARRMMRPGNRNGLAFQSPRRATKEIQDHLSAIDSALKGLRATVNAPH